MSGIFCQFNVGRAGVGGANARYITRPTATLQDEQGIILHNYPTYIVNKDYREMRRRIVEYNHQQEERELERPHRKDRKVRTHYRCKLSFEGKIDTSKAQEMAQEYIQDCFPNARVLAAVHQDTDNTHIHINIQARGIDGKKLHLNERVFHSLDSAWARIYGREFGRDRELQHDRKKAETREWKREYAEAKSRGEALQRPAPKRGSDRLRSEQHKERLERNYGTDKTGTGRDQRATADESGRTRKAEQAYERADPTDSKLARTEESVIRGAKEAVRSAEELHRNLEQAGRGVGEASRGVELAERGVDQTERGLEQTARGREETLHRTAELRSDLAELGERTRNRVDDTPSR
jgi:hypothetical protein